MAVLELALRYHADVIRTIVRTHLKMKISERAISDEKAKGIFLGFKTSWQKVMDKIMELLEKVSLFTPRG